MARKVQVHLLDDIDGTHADETVCFSLDGVSYEIDLSTANAKQLRAAVDTYISAGRRIGRGLVTSRVAAGARRSDSAPARSPRAANQEIRDWAKSNGVELNSRGRIPMNVIVQFREATFK